MTHYYIYKITCTAGSLKDHYYIGQHKTTNLDDEYKGSGRVIKDYYKKYPNDYVKEILCWCKDENELNAKEDFYVGDLYETDPLCLNLRAGGNQPGISEETCKKMSENNKGMKGKHHTEETKQKLSETMQGKKNPLYGKHLSEETKQKLSEANKGEKHPLYGKHRSEETRKKISEARKGKNVGKHWKNINGKRVWY